MEPKMVEEGIFPEETLEFLRKNLKDGTAELIDVVHLNKGWPAGVEISFKAKDREGSTARWTVILRYREHVARLLILLAQERADS